MTDRPGYDYAPDYLIERIDRAYACLVRSADRLRLRRQLDEQSRAELWHVVARLQDAKPGAADRLPADSIARYSMLVQWWSVYCEQARCEAVRRLPWRLRWLVRLRLVSVGAGPAVAVACRYDTFADWADWAGLLRLTEGYTPTPIEDVLAARLAADDCEPE